MATDPLVTEILTVFDGRGVTEAKATTWARIVRTVVKKDGADPTAPLRTQLAGATRIKNEAYNTGRGARASVDLAAAYGLTEDEGIQLFGIITHPEWAPWAASSA
jgi:hypothetical protein